MAANRVLIGYEPVQVESEGELEAAAVLTPPLSLEGGLAAELRPANLAQRVLSLFRNVSPGSDLSHFQVRLLFFFEGVTVYFQMPSEPNFELITHTDAMQCNQ